MRLRGFTLIELMIAIVIVAMLAGIVLPIGLSRLNADSLVQTQRQLESAVAIARADAQRRGVLMKLIAVEVGGATAIWSVEHDQTEHRDRRPRREFVLELPTGSTMEPAPTSEEEEPGEFAKEEDALRGNVGGEEASPVERALCVLMPDGTVVAGEAMMIRGRGGAMVRIGFNAWTGAMSFTTVQPILEDDADVVPEPAEFSGGMP